MSGRRRATLPADAPQAGLVVDARLHLLDRQILDREGVPVTTVDDLELRAPDGSAELRAGERAYVTALLTGPVLGTRIAGGRPPSSRWLSIPWRLVSDVGIVLRLGVDGDGIDASWTERWVRDHVIGRLPGGRHDPGPRG